MKYRMTKLDGIVLAEMLLGWPEIDREGPAGTVSTGHPFDEELDDYARLIKAGWIIKSGRPQKAFGAVWQPWRISVKGARALLKHMRERAKKVKP